MKSWAQTSMDEYHGDGALIDYGASPDTCPYCKCGKLGPCAGFGLRCPHCGSVFLPESEFVGNPTTDKRLKYRHSAPASPLLKRLNIDPVYGISSYPILTTEYDAPYCDCAILAFLEFGTDCMWRSMYCPKHNVILLRKPFCDYEHLKTIFEDTVYIINHETLHWILCKYFDDSTSRGLDKIPTMLLHVLEGMET